MSIDREDNTQELLRAAQSGNEAAQDALFRQYAPLIESLCRQYAVGAPSEEELHSEALYAFWNAICRFDPEQAEVTFGLFAKICVGNRLIDCQRKWKRIPPLLSLDSKELTALGADESTHPAHRVLEQEQYLALRRHMKEALSEGECRVWELFIEGQTVAEIAEHLKISKKSVENAIFRARQKLRKNLPPRA